MYMETGKLIYTWENRHSIDTDHEITQINELVYMTLKQLIWSVTGIKERIIIISEQEKHLRMNGNYF